MENKHDLLLGDDVPGSQVQLILQKNHPDENGRPVYITATLSRMGTGEIADRRLLAEHATALRQEVSRFFSSCNLSVAF